MKNNNIIDNGSITETVNKIKKTKNTSVKNLVVTFYDHDNNAESKCVIKNMYQMWKGAKEFFASDNNLGKRMTVEFNNEIIKDIRGERKTSGRLWLVDKMQIGKHAKSPVIKIEKTMSK